MLIARADIFIVFQQDNLVFYFDQNGRFYVSNVIDHGSHLRANRFVPPDMIRGYFPRLRMTWGEQTARDIAKAFGDAIELGNRFGSLHFGHGLPPYPCHPQDRMVSGKLVHHLARGARGLFALIMSKWEPPPPPEPAQEQQESPCAS